MWKRIVRAPPRPFSLSSLPLLAHLDNGAGSQTFFPVSGLSFTHTTRLLAFSAFSVVGEKINFLFTFLHSSSWSDNQINMNRLTGENNQTYFFILKLF